MWDIEKIIQFFRDKLGEFYTLPSRIAASRRRAAQLREVAARKGLAQQQTQLAAIDNKLSRMMVSHSELQGKLAAIFAKLGEFGIRIPGATAGGTLGFVPAIPIVVVAAASGVAIAIAAMLTDYAKQERLLKQIEAGILTPEEAKELGAGRPLFGLDLGKLAVPVALAIGAAILIPRLARG